MHGINKRRIVKTGNSKMDKNKINQIKQISYTFFFLLMVSAKGIGLDSGDRLYYILSAAACLCVGVKLVLTRYRMREIAAMALLCAIAFVAYRNSGRLGIVLTVLTVIGMKDMDGKKLFRMGTVVYGICFGFTVVAAKCGIIGNPMVVHEKGGMELIRWGMGYSTGNVFHVSYFMLTVLLCYTWGERYDWRRLAALMAGNFLVFFYSLSYTGVAVTAFYLLLDFYTVKRGRLGRAEKIFCQLPLPLCLLFSFGAPFLLRYPAVQRLDAMLQARLTFSAYYLQNQPITLLGTRMKDVPNFWVIMDNGYVYFLMTFGVVAFVLFCAGYAVLIARYVRSDRRTELAMIFSFLLYGIMEQFISNAFMNFSLLFFGELLFGITEAGTAVRPDGETEHMFQIRVRGKKGSGKRAGAGMGKTDGKRRLRGLVCGIAGAVVFTVYFFAAPVEEYVRVPVTALNYVQAQTVQMQAAETAGTKDAVKGQMEDCRRILENPSVLEAAVRECGMEGRISPEELAAALEYSLPVSVQNSGIYDTFRIRLLELYHDITEDEYAGLFNALLAHGQETWDGKYSVKEGIDAETIGKSSGEDRIEHMDKSRGYEVEKAGNIVKAEHVRDAVFYAVLAALTLFWSDVIVSAGKGWRTYGKNGGNRTSGF